MIMTFEDAMNTIEDGAELVKVGKWKWGTLDTYHVTVDGYGYLFTVRCHSQDGVQDEGPVTLFPARLVQRTVDVWERE